ncbi:uncharacterized protein F5147DRAFT_658430 [Suillus discolor]|uniref:MYND-type domain-containing protein n=1 Tax=Suillus discolor TaxID=1912936 RepID=A0A9P7EU48_9AGAM|nr:uncharacterized protein F5147DRAFT_658430 [Suillus discolor]KAG2089324.1 hypothetical protein F5147DRAFT_658430 [Suillus discolor]
METDSGTSPAASKGVRVEHTIYPERDNLFHSMAVSSEVLKENKKYFGAQCTQCGTEMKKLLKCAKCKSVWYCSKECQKKNWSTHKPTCHADERSSGLYKLVRMFSVNSVLMGYLKCGIVFECGLLDNPRIGFDTPFLARVEIAIEPSDVVKFVGLYVNDPSVEEKVEGMLQANAITPWPSPSMQAPLTPKRLNTWREARAWYNAEGFAEDPVGLAEFIGHRCTADSANSMTVELHIPKTTLFVAMTRAPFTSVSAITGIQTKKPLSAASFINSHIRADKQNQLFLQTEMTEEDKEVIRAAGRNEDTFSVRILKEKMEREQIYAGFCNR